MPNKRSLLMTIWMGFFGVCDGGEAEIEVFIPKTRAENLPMPCELTTHQGIVSAFTDMLPVDQEDFFVQLAHKDFQLRLSNDKTLTRNQWIEFIREIGTVAYQYSNQGAKTNETNRFLCVGVSQDIRYPFAKQWPMLELESLRAPGQFDRFIRLLDSFRTINSNCQSDQTDEQKEEILESAAQINEDYKALTQIGIVYAHKCFPRMHYGKTAMLWGSYATISTILIDAIILKWLNPIAGTVIPFVAPVVFFGLALIVYFYEKIFLVPRVFQTYNA